MVAENQVRARTYVTQGEKKRSKQGRGGHEQQRRWIRPPHPFRRSKSHEINRREAISNPTSSSGNSHPTCSPFGLLTTASPSPPSVAPASPAEERGGASSCSNRLLLGIHASTSTQRWRNLCHKFVDLTTWAGPLLTVRVSQNIKPPIRAIHSNPRRP